MDAAKSLLRHASEVSVIPRKIIIGKIIRCGTMDRERGTDGAFLVRADGSGWVFNHRTGEKKTFQAVENDGLAPEARSEQRARIEKKQREQEELQARRYEAASETAWRIWSLATPANSDHPYAIRKGIKVDGLRELNGWLLVPVYGIQGKLQSLQYINSEGMKRFLSGGKLAGGRFRIGPKPKTDDTILLCEGYATGATLLNETSYPVFVAFSASNLERIALSIRARFPKSKIIVCGDNDHETDKKTGKNPGIQAARRAASLIGGTVAFPPALPGISDFNDYAAYLKRKCNERYERSNGKRVS